MDALWLLRGLRSAPGWGALETDARTDKVDVALFDREGWALIRAPEAPLSYEGLTPASPADGLYLDSDGRSVYLVAGQEVRGPREVIAALGPEANELLKKIGDPDIVLERLGRVY